MTGNWIYGLQLVCVWFIGFAASALAQLPEPYQLDLRGCDLVSSPRRASAWEVHPVFKIEDLGMD